MSELHKKQAHVDKAPDPIAAELAMYDDLIETLPYPHSDNAREAKYYRVKELDKLGYFARKRIEDENK